jgi:hypothetical protein
MSKEPNSVRGTTRNDLDPEKVREILKEGKASNEELSRMLDESLHVVSGLREEIRRVRSFVEEAAKCGGIWMNEIKK